MLRNSDICLQMLIRGANAVGYTSYADNVVTEFCRLAALNGMDIFRIFDCFNIVDNMKVAIDAVRAAGKVAEVCICYTGTVRICLDEMYAVLMLGFMYINIPWLMSFQSIYHFYRRSLTTYCYCNYSIL